MADYDSRYIKDGHFDIAAMVNDDFVSAIRILWQAKTLQLGSETTPVLCSTRWLTCRPGKNNPGSFKQWLNKFVNLQRVGVTAEELWEHRNAVLHLSHYESNKVRDGSVRKLVLYAGRRCPAPDREHKYYDMHALLMAVFEGLGAYIAALNESDVMRKIFCDNYEGAVVRYRLDVPERDLSRNTTQVIEGLHGIEWVILSSFRAAGAYRSGF